MLLSVFIAEAHNDTDSLRTLRDVEVVTRQPPQGVRQRATGLSVSAAGLLRGMRTLGASDAVGALRLAPGVTGGSDYASGISVNGAPLAQSVYLIDGVPVFFPFHFGGIFSTFNTPHFSRFTLDTQGLRPDAPLRAGAVFEAVTSDMRPDSVTGVADIGLIASSLTIAAPAGSKASVAASVRTSYIDIIAPALIDNDDAKVRYSFTDANITAIYNPDHANTLKISAFLNTDRVKYSDLGYSMLTRMRWGNALAGASWRHSMEGAALMSRISVSHSSSRFGVDMPQISLEMASDITQFSGSAHWLRSSGMLHAGAAADLTAITPQHSSAGAAPSSLRAVEAYAYASVRRQVSGTGFAELYARVSASSCHGHTYICIDPRLTIERVTDAATTGVDVSVKSQHMQQVGFSDIGMSSNFWLPAMGDLRPMRTAGIDIRHHRPAITRHTGISASVFVRYVWHESQYRGVLTDILIPAYDPLQHVRQVDGFNAGCNLSADINTGPLAGRAAYSFAVCRRHYPESPGRWLPSASEPLHSLKLTGEYAFNRRWKASAAFTLASGRRYTPVDAVYVVGGNVLIEYGDSYSASLPLYHRLDLSATCDLSPFRIGRREITSFVTLSLLNAYGHRNAEMVTVGYDASAGTIGQHFIASLYKYLPSVSYTLKF